MKKFLWTLLFFSPICVVGQSPDTAAVSGAVVDPQGKVIVGAHVSIEDAQHRVLGQAVSGSEGEFTVRGLPVGQTLTLNASAPGFKARPAALSPVAGERLSVDVGMFPATPPGDIIVTENLDHVRTDEPQLGDRLTAEQAQAMPLPNRRISFLPLVNAANHPAINQGDVFMNQELFTANGTGRRQTWFEVNGANANDMWGRQTIFTNVPLSAIGEMTVLESAFAADYGFGEGAVVNVVTRSGGSGFHGNVLGLWRPSGPEAALSGFTAKNAASGNDITRDTLAQGAATVSGPVTKLGQTYYTGSAEYSYQDRASPVISPLAPGNYIGHYRDWMGLLRVDHTIREGQRVFAFLSADGFFDTNPNGTVGGNNLPSVARVFHRKTYTGELGDTAVLNPTMVNEARVEFQLASPITQFSPVIYGTQYQVPISSGGTFTSGTSQAALLMNRQYEVVDNLAKTLRKSELRVGFDVIHAHSGGNSKEFGGPIYLGQLVYNACAGTPDYCESQAYLGNIANVKSYTQSYGNANYVVGDTLAGVFGQWDVHPRSDVTLNLGLRYEVQTFTDARANLAPRVGFAYNVAGHGTTTVRGGFGIYYSQVVDNEQANYALTGPTGVFNYTAAPGQPGFPTSVADVPVPAFPAGAKMPIRSLYLRPGRASYYDQFLPTSALLNYPDALLNPYNEQWTLGVERQLARTWVLSADYVGSHTLKIVRPLDVDAPTSFVRTAPGQVRTAQVANCTRPYWAAWYTQNGGTCDSTSNQGKSGSTPPYSVIQSDVNDGAGYYEALDVNLNHHAHNGSALLASYTWSHAIDTVDPDIPGQNPNDARQVGEAEMGNAIFDQRHRLVLSGVYATPWGFTMGGTATMGGGLPYNYTTGVTNSGDTGATADRPVINGVVVGRNTGRGTAIYDLEPLIGKRITLVPERVHANLRAEAFNVLNHRNGVGFSGTYGNGATAGNGFGTPLAGITNQLPAREMQFSAQIEF
jgi:hypothetical protein